MLNKVVLAIIFGVVVTSVVAPTEVLTIVLLGSIVGMIIVTSKANRLREESARMNLVEKIGEEEFERKKAELTEKHLRELERNPKYTEVKERILREKEVEKRSSLGNSINSTYSIDEEFAD